MLLNRCVSVNEVVCHNCPLSSDPPQLLKDGDLVKVDMGVHVDGTQEGLAFSTRRPPARSFS
jgi:methionine aminopeptidase